MNVTQLSVFIENKPGHLQNILKVLSDENINIITLTIAETADFGILRMIVDDVQKAKKHLKANNFTSSVTDVLAIELEDKPSSLYDAIEIFTKKNLNIEYMYAFTEKREGKGVMIFRFDDIESAKLALEDDGLNILRKIEIMGE